MAAMTLTEIQTETRQAVGDNNSAIFEDPAIVEAINWAATEVARMTGLTYTEYNASLSSGVATVPADCISVNRVYVRLT